MAMSKLIKEYFTERKTGDLGQMLYCARKTLYQSVDRPAVRGRGSSSSRVARRNGLSSTHHSQVTTGRWRGRDLFQV